MPDPNYVSEIEREDGTVLTIKDAEARAAIGDMDPTLQQILQGVNDIKSSIGDVGEIVEEVLVGPPTLIEKTITENGTYDASDDEADGYSSVTVEVSGGGAGGGDVIFYDYDGSIVTSYSAADFANLSAMPANPTHAGLTAQGWNWSLSDAKTHVAANGKLDIGQMYITSDGKTRIYCIITERDSSIGLYLDLDEDTELDIDWGDNTEHTTWTSEDGEYGKSHEYSDVGRYTVAITVVSGGFNFTSGGDFDTYYPRKIELGTGITNIGYMYSFVNLTSITIPNSVTSLGYGTFQNCYSLSSVTIPNSVTTIGNNTFQNCYALSSVIIPNSVTSIENSAFDYCSALSSITILSSVTSIGENAFQNCHALSLITIPSSVTSIGGSAFSDCYALSSITFESTTPPELLNGDLGITSTCIIRVPQGTLEDYTSANYYPDPSAYIYEEY